MTCVTWLLGDSPGTHITYRSGLLVNKCSIFRCFIFEVYFRMNWMKCNQKITSLMEILMSTLNSH